jgi:O-antigen/teichoic acid export membrane protein
MERSIVKNTAWLFSGQVIGRALRAIVVIYAARVLGAASWGIFSYVISLAAAFTVLSDVGVSALLVREGSRNPSSRGKFLSTSLVVKLVVLAVLALFAVFFGGAIVRIPEAAALIPIVVLIFCFDSLRDLVSALARSLNRMDIEAKGQVITNASIVAFCFIALFFSPTAEGMASGYVAGTLIGLLSVLYPLRREFSGIFSRFDKGIVKTILLSAWPFGLVSLMGVVMINTDVLVLGISGSSVDVGLYSAAQKPVQLLYLVPALLAAAFFPNMAEAVKDREKFNSLFRKGIKAVCLFAFPVALGGAVLAEPIVSLVYGAEYVASVYSFLILCLTCIFVFPSVFMTNAIFAEGKRGVFAPFALIGILGNILLDIALIPRFGIAGCALATLAVQSALFCYGLFALQGVVHRPLSGLWRIVLSSFFMASAALGLHILGVNVVLTIALSAVFYFASLIVLREPAVKEVLGILKRTKVPTSGVEV